MVREHCDSSARMRQALPCFRHTVLLRICQQAILLLSLGSAAAFFGNGAYWASTIDLARPYAGTVSGFMNMVGNLGGTISPTLTPWIAQQFGWETVLYVAAALALVGSALWLGVHPERVMEFQATVAFHPLLKRL